MFHAADGACYELNTPGPCPRDTAAVAGCQGTPCFMRCARADNIYLIAIIKFQLVACFYIRLLH